jgi:hypothetical protein
VSNVTDRTCHLKQQVRNNCGLRKSNTRAKDTKHKIEHFPTFYVQCFGRFDRNETLYEDTPSKCERQGCDGFQNIVCTRKYPNSHSPTLALCGLKHSRDKSDNKLNIGDEKHEYKIDPLHNTDLQRYKSIIASLKMPPALSK